MNRVETFEAESRWPGGAPAGKDKPGVRVNYAQVAEAAGYHLRRAQLAVAQDFAESLGAHDLRPADFSILSVIAHNPGLKQSEVAAALGIQRANLVAMVDDLETRGLAERRKPETDRRVQELFITEAGSGYLGDITTLWRRHEDRLIARLGGPREHRRLIELLSRLC